MPSTITSLQELPPTWLTEVLQRANVLSQGVIRQVQQLIPGSDTPHPTHFTQLAQFHAIDFDSVSTNLGRMIWSIASPLSGGLNSVGNTSDPCCSNTASAIIRGRHTSQASFIHQLQSSRSLTVLATIVGGSLGLVS